MKSAPVDMCSEYTRLERTAFRLRKEGFLHRIDACIDVEKSLHIALCQYQRHV
jgi:hypothetical protein